MAKDRTRETAVIEASINFWKAHRPVKWSEGEHLEHPSVNIPSAEGHDLAIAVAEYVKAPFLARKERSDTQMDIVLKAAGKVALASQRLLNSRVLDFSKNAQSLEEALNVYNNEVMKL